MSKVEVVSSEDSSEGPPPLAQAEQPVIEEMSDSDEGPPPLTEANDENVEQNQGGESSGKQSKSEKKARKAVQKLGYKVVPGITRATIKQKKTVMIIVESPDVYKSPNNSTYVVFGKATVEDVTQNALKEAAGNFDAGAFDNMGGDVEDLDGDDIPDLVEEGQKAVVEGEQEAVDETGVEAKDIDLVMAQVSCTRGQAVAALRKNDGDIVNAIMELQF